MNKHDINLENHAFNTFFSGTYMKVCIGLHWLALGILVLATMLEGSLRQWIIYSVVWVIALNTLYVIYRFIKYRLIKKSFK